MHKLSRLKEMLFITGTRLNSLAANRPFYSLATSIFSFLTGRPLFTRQENEKKLRERGERERVQKP